MELIQIDCDGKTYRGYYTVARETVIVSYRDSTKSTPVGGSPPQSIAERLLRELVDSDPSTRVAKPPAG